MFMQQLFPEQPLTVGDVANELRLSIDTVRRWEKKGLIRANRNIRGQRLFDLEEVRLLKQKLNEKPAGCFKVLKAETLSSYSVIELFAGAGGLALGLSNAGLQTTMLVEIDKQAATTLRNNRPAWNVLQEDVRTVNFIGKTADIITGGFPCQSFSYAGKKTGCLAVAASFTPARRSGGSAARRAGGAGGRCRRRPGRPGRGWLRRWRRRVSAGSGGPR